MPSGLGRGPPGPVVGVAHVLLVHPEDAVRGVLELAEKREEARKIGFPAGNDRPGGIFDGPELRPEPAEEVAEAGGFFSLAGQSDCIELDLQGFFELGFVLVDKGAAALGLP